MSTQHATTCDYLVRHGDCTCQPPKGEPSLELPRRAVVGSLRRRAVDLRDTGDGMLADFVDDLADDFENGAEL